MITMFKDIKWMEHDLLIKYSEDIMKFNEEEIDQITDMLNTYYYNESLTKDDANDAIFEYNLLWLNYLLTKKKVDCYELPYYYFPVFCKPERPSDGWISLMGTNIYGLNQLKKYVCKHCKVGYAWLFTRLKMKIFLREKFNGYIMIRHKYICPPDYTKCLRYYLINMIKSNFYQIRIFKNQVHEYECYTKCVNEQCANIGVFKFTLDLNLTNFKFRIRDKDDLYCGDINCIIYVIISTIRSSGIDMKCSSEYRKYMNDDWNIVSIR